VSARHELQRTSGCGEGLVTQSSSEKQVPPGLPDPHVGEAQSYCLRPSTSPTFL
jgi:hypothetical protein